MLYHRYSFVVESNGVALSQGFVDPAGNEVSVQRGLTILTDLSFALLARLQLTKVDVDLNLVLIDAVKHIVCATGGNIEMRIDGAVAWADKRLRNKRGFIDVRLERIVCIDNG